MGEGWEYKKVFGSAKREGAGADRKAAVHEAQQQWISRLNELGAEGWELVSESFVTGESLNYAVFAEYSGTMKRPRPDSGS